MPPSVRVGNDSLESLKFRLTERMNRFDAKVNKSMKEIVVKTHYVIASGTPVDTGQARSNWRASSAALVPTNVIQPYAPGKKLGLQETGNLAASQAQVRRAVRPWRARSGKPLHLFNNWPLITELNNGSISAQGRNFIEEGQRVSRNLMRKEKWFR